MGILDGKEREKETKLFEIIMTENLLPNQCSISNHRYLKLGVHQVGKMSKILHLGISSSNYRKSKLKKKILEEAS